MSNPMFLAFGDGSTTVFNLPNNAYLGDLVLVGDGVTTAVYIETQTPYTTYIYKVTNGVAAALALTTDYTLTNVLDKSQLLTLNVAPAVGVQIYCSEVPIAYKVNWQGTQRLYTTPRTNNWLQNSALGTAPNSLAGVTATGTSGTAPDGTNTAWKIAEDAANAVHVLLQSITYGNADVTQSVYVKAVERTKCAVTTDASAGFFVHCDLSAGIITSITGSGTGTITSVGNGWYRVTVTSTVTAGAKSARVYVALNANSVAAYQGVAGSGILVWHPQSQLASEGTGDIPTAASAVTVTDYAVSGNGTVLTLSPAPAAASSAFGPDQLLWDGWTYDRN